MDTLIANAVPELPASPIETASEKPHRHDT